MSILFMSGITVVWIAAVGAVGIVDVLTVISSGIDVVSLISGAAAVLIGWVALIFNNAGAADGVVILISGKAGTDTGSTAAVLMLLIFCNSIAGRVVSLAAVTVG